MRDITLMSRVTVTRVTRDPRARARLCGRARPRPTPTPIRALGEIQTNTLLPQPPHESNP